MVDNVFVDGTIHTDMYDYADVLTHATVFNFRTLDSFMFVRIPSAYLQNFTIYEVKEIQPTTCNCDNFLKYRCKGRPWFKIPIKCLNLDIGLHVYAFKFLNKVTLDSFTQYIAYTVQSEDAVRNYIYMRDDNEES